MKFLDLSDNSRLARLIDLTSGLRKSQNPYDALLLYTRYLRDANPGRGQMVVSTSGLSPGQYRVWRLLGDDGIERVELCDPWEKLDLPIYSGGNIARIIERKIPQIVHDIDWKDDPHFAQLLGPYRSLMAVPLYNEGLPLNWSIGLSREPSFFTASHLEESTNRAALVGSLLGSLYVGSELAKANAYINQELERMARIQRSLLPEPIPQIPGLNLAASYETFGQVGGDLYDFISLKNDDSQWCIFIGDASGHGPSAAVVAAMVQATLHDCACGSVGPGALFKTLNQRLCQKSIEGSFVTAFMAFYDHDGRRLRYASAGHPAPLFPNSSLLQGQYLNAAGGLPLGIEKDATFEEATIDLSPGNTILLYTDGITEARCPDGNMFGPEGIQRSLQGSFNVQSAIDHLRRSLLKHQRGRRPDDDQTAVAIQVQ